MALAVLSKLKKRQMKKLFIALVVCALTLPTTSTYAEQKQRTDTPDDVQVEFDENGQLKEVIVIVYRDKKVK